MKVRYTRRALGDIAQIHDFLAERSVTGARHVLRDIYRAIEFIADRPEGAERTDDPRVRVKIVIRYRYKIFYRLADDGVEILHVRHSSRRPWQPD